MRCRACDCDLTDFEATRLDRNTKKYIDMCLRCDSESHSVRERYELWADKDSEAINEDLVG